jgi:hypothetical protein
VSPSASIPTTPSRALSRSVSSSIASGSPAMRVVRNGPRRSRPAWISSGPFRRLTPVEPDNRPRLGVERQGRVAPGPRRDEPVAAADEADRHGPASAISPDGARSNTRIGVPESSRSSSVSPSDPGHSRAPLEQAQERGLGGHGLGGAGHHRRRAGPDPQLAGR